MIISLFYLSITFVSRTTSQNDEITLESVAIVSSLIYNVKIFYLLVITFFACILLQIHRHGDRTPLMTFPTDVHLNDSYWPDGWGQLTKVCFLILHIHVY